MSCATQRITNKAALAKADEVIKRRLRIANGSALLTVRSVASQVTTELLDDPRARTPRNVYYVVDCLLRDYAASKWGKARKVGSSSGHANSPSRNIYQFGGNN